MAAWLQDMPALEYSRGNCEIRRYRSPHHCARIGINPRRHIHRYDQRSLRRAALSYVADCRDYGSERVLQRPVNANAKQRVHHHICPPTGLLKRNLFHIRFGT